jgi:hypothetical protein
MKPPKILFIACSLLFGTKITAQEQFSGLLNSPRVSLLQGLNNPAELVNLDKKNEIAAGNFSFIVSNNKIASSDIFSNADLESKLFNSPGDINMNVSTQFISIGYGIRWKRFGVSLSSNTYGQFNLENINPLLGDALLNSGGNFLNVMPINIQSDKLQKLNMTLYTDIAVGFGIKILNAKNHKINAGVNAKLLFPKAFANIGIDQLNAQLIQVNQGVNAFTATGNINIAYSADTQLNTTTLNPFSDLSFSNLSGVSLGFGFNYQYYRTKDLENGKTNNYLINIGASYTNSGKAKFDSNATKSHNYQLNITPNALNPNGLDLNQIGSLSSPNDIYNLLSTNNFITSGTSNKEVNIELPKKLNLYADIKFLKVLYGSVYWQKNLNDTNNLNISSPDYLTITPRLVLGKFELFTPFTNSSIAETSIGAGIKWGMFYMTSSSGLSMAFGSTKQADFSIGLSKGF